MSGNEETGVGNNGESNAKRLGGVTGKGFMPGQSGNPSGRPKKKPVTDILEEIFEDKEFIREHLRGVISGKSAVAKVMLVEKAAERLEGKVVQPVELDVNLSVFERLEKARKRAEIED